MARHIKCNAGILEKNKCQKVCGFLYNNPGLFSSSLKRIWADKDIVLKLLLISMHAHMLSHVRHVSCESDAWF